MCRQVTEALCRGHAGRKFYELADIAAGKRRGKHAPPISTLALEAVTRIDALFDIEREINGQPARHRLAVRGERSAPPVAELETWMGASVARGGAGVQRAGCLSGFSCIPGGEDGQGVPRRRGGGSGGASSD